MHISETFLHKGFLLAKKEHAQEANAWFKKCYIILPSYKLIFKQNNYSDYQTKLEELVSYCI